MCNPTYFRKSNKKMNRLPISHPTSSNLLCLMQNYYILTQEDSQKSNPKVNHLNFNPVLDLSNQQFFKYAYMYSSLNFSLFPKAAQHIKYRL